MLSLRFEITSMNPHEFMTKEFCGNKDIGHPHPLEFVRTVDVNNDVAGKK